MRVPLPAMETLSTHLNLRIGVEMKPASLASSILRLTPSPAGWARRRGPLALRLNYRIVSASLLKRASQGTNRKWPPAKPFQQTLPSAWRAGGQLAQHSTDLGPGHRG